MMDAMIVLVTKPFSLFKLAILFCLRTAFVIIQTWMELFKATTSFYLSMIWRTMIGVATVISLPVQVLTALPRERLLEQHLNEMRLEMESLVWDRKQLQDHLQTVLKERRIMESMLAELEDELDKAIEKIELLEVELQDLKDENRQLKEIYGKGGWRSKGDDATGNREHVTIPDKCNIPYEFSSWKPSFKESDIYLRDLMVHGDTWEHETKSKNENLNLTPTKFAAPGSRVIPRNIEMKEVLDQKRGDALSRSLFSVVLSLVVGITAWEAEDPCMPLVVALFIVVGLSLKSVVQFFYTIKNKPALDAVALLSFNWFILGTLSYPTLPWVGRILAPSALRFADHTMSLFGISLH